MIINNRGKVLLYFSQPFVIPANHSNINSTAIDVELLTVNLVEDTYLNYTWNCTDYT